jgi:hypothetical protein
MNDIGIVIQDTGTVNHSIPDKMAYDLLQEFETLEQSYNVKYIAHYIDDLKYGARIGKDVLYSAYSEDFASIFNLFDYVISTRVHGCGIASSLGIPNMLIPHDGRFSTALKFKSVIYNDKMSLSDQVRAVNISESSAELINHRKSSEEEYIQLIKNNFSILKS